MNPNMNSNMMNTVNSTPLNTNSNSNQLNPNAPGNTSADRYAALKNVGSNEGFSSSSTRNIIRISFKVV